MARSGKRIIHVPRRFSQAEWGGTEAVVANLCFAQQAQGFQPEIHTSLALSKSRRETWRSVPVRRYPYCYPFFGLSKAEKHALDKKGGNLLSLSLFASLATLSGVRLYHAHVTKRMGGSVFTAARLRGKPCVVTLHGNMFDVPESEASELVASQEGHFEWGKPFGALFRSRKLLEEADAVLCVGYSEYEKAQDALGPERVRFLPNGVHAEKFQLGPGEREAARERLEIPPEAFLFGCISRLDPQKNQLGLIEAFSLHAARHPDAYLLLSGPETVASYGEKIRAAIAASPVGHRIRLMPPVEPESTEHRGLFGALDTFVLASRHEPFGIVVLEAWAAGKPVIVSEVGGLARLVKNEISGLHVPSGDAAALAAAMDDLAGNAVKRAELAAAGGREIQQRYAWEQVAQTLENIYQEVEARHA